MRWPYLIKLSCIVLCFVTMSAMAELSVVDENFAKMVQNPIADLISLPFQNNTNYGLGKYNRTQDILYAQPLLPFNLNPNWTIYSRTIIPYIVQPDLLHPEGYTDGLGDIIPAVLIGPRFKGGNFLWAAGPTVSIPTATNQVLGAGKWSAGPEVVLVAMPGRWVFAAIANNFWSFAGDKDRRTVNLGVLQTFVNFNITNGWYLVSSPVITADWEAQPDNRWTVPVGGGIGKIFRINRTMGINTQIQAFDYAASPKQFGPNWTLRFELQFLFPKKS